MGDMYEDDITKRMQGTHVGDALSWQQRQQQLQQQQFQRQQVEAAADAAAPVSSFTGLSSPVVTGTLPAGRVEKVDPTSNRASIKPELVQLELVQKNKYVKDAVRGTGVYWTEISSRSPFHTLSYGDDFKIWVNDQVQRKKNMLSSASSHRSSGISKGGKKSRRNTRRRKNSKKQKRVRHTRRKQTRRHRHRRSRHRR